MAITEVLYAVMTLNESLGRQNNKEFTHILVGGYQGLYARSRRPIYAPSKAYGLDLCSSLVDGNEVAKCVYLAPGPIDTAMLHRNHWVMKAGGSKRFFDETLDGPAEAYRSIFVECDEAALAQKAAGKPAMDLDNLRLAMGRYRTERQAYMRESGILSPIDCANSLADILTCHDLHSGVYGLKPQGAGKEAAVNMAVFPSLDRRVTFELAARPVVLN